ELSTLYQTACADNSRLLLKTGQQFGKLCQTFDFNQQLHIANTIRFRNGIHLTDIDLIRENYLRQIFEQTTSIISFHHNLYALTTSRLHFPIGFYSTFRLLGDHADIVRTSHLMNAHSTIQSDIASDRLTMLRLATLRDMQFHVIQTVDQNPVR